MSSQRKIGRREFLASTAVVVTGYAAGGNIAVAAGRRQSPNETVNVGLIGLGGRCKHLAGTELARAQACTLQRHLLKIQS